MTHRHDLNKSSLGPVGRFGFTTITILCITAIATNGGIRADFHRKYLIQQAPSTRYASDVILPRCIDGQKVHRGDCASISVGNPYISGTQVLHSNNLSFYRQPYRGYMATVPATEFLNGIIVNYNPMGGSSPSRNRANIKYLASIGIHDIRIELPWDAVSPSNEAKLTTSAERKYGAIFRACQTYHILPTILLNANSGQPEPAYQTRIATVVGNPQTGDSEITVRGVSASDITVHSLGTTTGSRGIPQDKVGDAGKCHYQYKDEQ